MYYELCARRDGDPCVLPRAMDGMGTSWKLWGCRKGRCSVTELDYMAPSSPLSGHDMTLPEALCLPRLVRTHLSVQPYRGRASDSDFKLIAPALRLVPFACFGNTVLLTGPVGCSL